MPSAHFTTQHCCSLLLQYARETEQFLQFFFYSICVHRFNLQFYKPNQHLSIAFKPNSVYTRMNWSSSSSSLQWDSWIEFRFKLIKFRFFSCYYHYRRHQYQHQHHHHHNHQQHRHFSFLQPFHLTLPPLGLISRYLWYWKRWSGNQVSEKSIKCNKRKIFP